MLRGALERDGRQMSTSAVEADSEMERDSGLTADESLRRGARRAPRPPRAGFKALPPRCRACLLADGGVHHLSAPRPDLPAVDLPLAVSSDRKRALLNAGA